MKLYTRRVCIQTLLFGVK